MEFKPRTVHPLTHSYKEYDLKSKGQSHRPVGLWNCKIYKPCFTLLTADHQDMQTDKLTVSSQLLIIIRKIRT
jgi:hypothetical protein